MWNEIKSILKEFEAVIFADQFEDLVIKCLKKGDFASLWAVNLLTGWGAPVEDLLISTDQSIAINEGKLPTDWRCPLIFGGCRWIVKGNDLVEI